MFSALLHGPDLYLLRWVHTKDTMHPTRRQSTVQPKQLSPELDFSSKRDEIHVSSIQKAVYEPTGGGSKMLLLAKEGK